jgi:hypothetical protein
MSFVMRATAWLFLAVIFAGVPASAAPPARAEPPCTSAPSALSGLACELARAVRVQAANAVVVGLAPTLSPSTPLKPGVAVALAVKVALALGPGASAWPLAEDRAHLTHFSSPRPLVVIQPKVETDMLVASLELFAPSATPSTHAAGQLEPSVRLSAKRGFDAEVRPFLPPIAIAARELVRLGPAESDVVALACGDLDGTGVPVVASIGRTFVTFGTYRAGKYAVLSRREERELAPVAPAPLREPLGTAWITPARTLDFGLSDRAHAVRLRGTQAEALAARLPWPGGGCANLAAPFVAPRAVRCSKDEPVVSGPALSEPLDALAGASIVSRAGDARLVRAGRLASGAVVVTDGGREIRLDHGGAQLALADLDGDGAPELVTSLDTLDPHADAVVVYSWLGSVLNERARVPVPAGVRALAVCPAPADRMPSIVLATNDGLWVIR